MILTILLLLTTLALAAINGANDNSKGAATLIGSGLMSTRGAIWMATLATAAGGLASILLAQGLLAAFSGKGIVPDSLTVSVPFLIAVAGAATATVGLATMASLPISTTHALFGGLVGAGLVHDAGGVQFAKAAAIIVVPLLLSPLMAAVLALVVAPLLRRTAHAPAASRVARSDGPIESLATPPLRSLRGIDLLHVLSAAVVGFARGLNDTPKIAALLVAAGVGGVAGASSSVVIAMAIGGWLGAHRVAKTLAWRVTAMDPREGLAGNLVTSTLVIAASRFGLPVSTTHVSTGALFGIGLSNGKANFRIIAMILLAWGVTLPTSAMIAALLHFLLPSV